MGSDLLFLGATPSGYSVALPGRRLQGLPGLSLMQPQLPSSIENCPQLSRQRLADAIRYSQEMYRLLPVFLDLTMRDSEANGYPAVLGLLENIIMAWLHEMERDQAVLQPGEKLLRE